MQSTDLQPSASSPASRKGFNVARFLLIFVGVVFVLWSTSFLAGEIIPPVARFLAAAFSLEGFVSGVSESFDQAMNWIPFGVRNNPLYSLTVLSVSSLLAAYFLELRVAKALE